MYVIVPASSDRVNRDNLRLSPALNGQRLRERKGKQGFKVSDDPLVFGAAQSRLF